MMLTAEQTAAGEALEDALCAYLADYMREHRELATPVLAGALVRVAAGIGITCDLSKESFLRGAEKAYAAVLVSFEAARG